MVLKGIDFATGYMLFVFFARGLNQMEEQDLLVLNQGGEAMNPGIPLKETTRESLQGSFHFSFAAVVSSALALFLSTS